MNEEIQLQILGEDEEQPLQNRRSNKEPVLAPSKNQRHKRQFNTLLDNQRFVSAIHFLQHYILTPNGNPLWQVSFATSPFSFELFLKSRQSDD
jgi:hypothetical protein